MKRANKKAKIALVTVFAMIICCISAFGANEKTVNSGCAGNILSTVTNSIAKGFDYLKNADLYRRYGDFTVTLDLGAGITDTIGAEKIVSWISVSDSGSEYYNDTKINQYISNLAATYDTAGKTHTITTSYGNTVDVTAGTYGWKMDQTKTQSALKNALYAHATQTVSAVWSKSAASHGTTDFGGTYVEISLSNQHLFLYKDGVKIMETDIVTGNLAQNRGTPGGIYPIAYKARNQTLTGQGYASPVSYWMPFNGGIGLHDATWRSSFGGTIYKYSGSHGCVNMPLNAAKTVYETVSAGTAVILY